MQMIHMRSKEDADLTIFCEDATEERKTQDFKDYKSDGYKEVGAFSLTLIRASRTFLILLKVFSG